jgi:hypothetical protein
MKNEMPDTDCSEDLDVEISGGRTYPGGDLQNHDGYSVIVNDIATGHFPGRK